MHLPKLFTFFLAFLAVAGLACAQQPGPQDHPNATFGDTPKSNKPSKFRTILGTVRDEADNPAPGAIVQLKDLKTSKVVDFVAKDDGKFVFRDRKSVV